MEEGSDYYVVRKGDVVAVYGTLRDCQAQICSSVSGPAASAYKVYSWSREKEGYFSSHGLSNAAYVINATELTEDILGPLEPCSIEDIIQISSDRPIPRHTGPRDGIRNQTGSQSVDWNNEARYGSYRNFSPKNSTHSGAVDVQPVSRQYGGYDGTLLNRRDLVHSTKHALALYAPMMVGILHFDGAAKGNPGKAGAGAVLMTEDGRVISRLREGLGIATNNVAEYRGLVLGLRYAIRHGLRRIKIHGDSQLVCNQVKGIWQTKNQNMMELCQEVRRMKENFVSFEISHVPREWNSEADRQANIGITLATGVVSEERGDGF